MYLLRNSPLHSDRINSVKLRSDRLTALRSLALDQYTCDGKLLPASSPVLALRDTEDPGVGNSDSAVPTTIDAAANAGGPVSVIASGDRDGDGTHTAAVHVTDATAPTPASTAAATTTSTAALAPAIASACTLSTNAASPTIEHSSPAAAVASAPSNGNGARNASSLRDALIASSSESDSEDDGSQKLKAKFGARADFIESKASHIPGSVDTHPNRKYVKGYSDNEDEDAEDLFYPRSCYVCKARFHKLHAFYDQLCPSCAALNWEKRNQVADLQGRVCLVTGARVKIGFHCGLKLLRCGATVIATSRFPHDTAKRYAQEADFSQWRERLHVYGLDLRDLRSVTRLTDMIASRYPRLDVIVNNAAQVLTDSFACLSYYFSCVCVRVSACVCIYVIRHIMLLCRPLTCCLYVTFVFSCNYLDRSSSACLLPPLVGR